MLRTVARAGIFVTLVGLVGCAGMEAQNRTPAWQSRADELASAQSRLELRLEEVTRNLLALRERLDAQEESLKSLEQARNETPTAPPLRVVKLEPQPPVATPAPGPAAAPPTASGDTAAADLYRRAFNAYREQRYGQAILDFEEFLRSYPDHEYGDNAQYWIGESYYSQGEYQQAIAEFNRVLDHYPSEAKAPDALLKIGLSYEKLGDGERARVLWDRLVGQYPQSEAARQAQRLLAAKP